MAGPADFDQRYAPNWGEISRLARSLTRDRCVLCQGEAEETHHALYEDRHGAIAGREIPGVHVFPLCASCHQGDGGAHATSHWHRDLRDPVAGNHHSPDYYRKLPSAWIAVVHPGENDDYPAHRTEPRCPN